MYDVNDHPMQDELNKALGGVLADVIKKLRVVSNVFDVDEKELTIQFKESWELFIELERLERNKLWQM